MNATTTNPARLAPPMTERYVTAFRGRRDSYQVPLALSESHQLDQFITDIYALPRTRSLARFFPASVRAKLDFRHDSAIPENRIHCLWGAAAHEHLRHYLRYPRMATFHQLDPCFALAAAQRARKTRSHLFLYSSYALEAFTARYPHTPRKVLFQYHPHPELERRVLAHDSQIHPNFAGDLTDLPSQREYDAWKYADFIFCASSFTRRSLLEVGADKKKLCVVPYGMESFPLLEHQPSKEAFQALYVGTGLQRKGLHHLLWAWGKAALPKNSRLLMVCRMISPELEQLAATVPGVELRRGVNELELKSLYETSSLFVMPSLIEGFGQVYLEALAHGCPVLGTVNTALPDLGTEADGIFLVTPGNIEELSAQLEWLSQHLGSNPQLRHAARACAGRFTWQAFRQELRLKLNSN